MKINCNSKTINFIEILSFNHHVYIEVLILKKKVSAKMNSQIIIYLNSFIL